MTGEQLQQFEAALLDAYPSRLDLQRMLLFSPLGRRLSDYAGDVGMREVVFKLLDAAVQGGWISGLVDATLADRPGNAALRRWAGTHLWAPPEAAALAPPPELQVLDTAFFDLLEIKRAVTGAKLGSSSRLLGFGVDYSEMVFVNKLCAWLPSCLGEVECKEWLSLRPEIASVDVRIKHITRYVPDLASVNVVCPVLADGVPTELVAAFWDGVRAHCGEPDRWFVVIFAGTLSAGYPETITTLAAPRFDRLDLALWTQELVSRLGWPAPLADAWTNLIEEQAADAPGLDVRLAYEAMDRSIRAARQDQAGFRRVLERRTGRADPSPR